MARLLKKRSALKKRVYRKRKAAPRRRTMRPMRSIATNTAAVRECYNIAIPDGNMTFFRQLALGDIQFDRAQTVAQAFQEYRVKYIKLTFRPSADTFTPVAGNVIPQLYFCYDKANSVPLSANAGTLLSMGVRPRRMDDKNLVYAWKPTVLSADLINPGATTGSQIFTRPWLSTNANSGNPQLTWAPSIVDHLGAVWYVEKINPADALNYVVEVECVFQFRKPVWRQEQSATPTPGLQLDNGELKPIVLTPV